MDRNESTARKQDRSHCGRRVSVLWGLLLLLALIPDQAKAYIDPGAGTIVWQALVAGFLGAVFYLRRLIPGRRSKEENEPTEPKV